MGAVIPTLHAGMSEIVRTDADKLAYIIRHAFKNPGNTSLYIEDSLISFRKLDAEYGRNGVTLAGVVENRLLEIATELIEDLGSLTVTYQSGEDPLYHLIVEATNKSGVAILQSVNIAVSPDDFQINLTN